MTIRLAPFSPSKGLWAAVPIAIALAAALAQPAAAAAPPAVDEGKMEKAARKFDAMLAREGMVGAQVYSLSCHEKADKSRSWSKRDFCAAFDLAASLADNAMVQVARFPRNEYFEAAAEHAPDHYRTLSDDEALIAGRLDTIVDAVKPALLSAAQARAASD